MFFGFHFCINWFNLKDAFIYIDFRIYTKTINMYQLHKITIEPSISKSHKLKLFNKQNWPKCAVELPQFI